MLDRYSEKKNLPALNGRLSTGRVLYNRTILCLFVKPLKNYQEKYHQNNKQSKMSMWLVVAVVVG